MEINVRLGANNDGRIRALDVTTLSNSGAYGEHGWATVGLTGHKSIPLYTGSLEAFKFTPTWCTRTCSLRARTVASARRRASSPWKPR